MTEDVPNPPKVPQPLVEAILEGRCVAFVGAGFSAPSVPPWRRLLQALNARTAPGELRDTIDAELASTERSALQLEGYAELIRERLEGADLQRALREIVSDVGALDSRRELLASIPFRAVLTTNFDPSLKGDALTPGLYWDVLRGEHPWWRRAIWEQHEEPHAPVLKLHGDVDAADQNPVVLGRRGYRSRLYEDGRYANFVKAVFASRTVLFLGVSFTDAYLNELRSEVLAFLWGRGDEREPWGYAVLPDAHSATQAYFRRHEGIEILSYPTAGEEGHAGFDAWLSAIARSTSTEGTLAGLLGGEDVVWIDPAPTTNNQRGLDLLERVGARLARLSSSAELREDEHREAALLITHFGHREGGGAAAFDVLDVVRRWPDHPPVVVFASGDHAADNRRALLRSGAWEYASSWAELFQLVQLLFGRRASAAG